MNVESEGVAQEIKTYHITTNRSVSNNTCRVNMSNSISVICQTVHHELYFLLFYHSNYIFPVVKFQQQTPLTTCLER